MSDDDSPLTTLFELQRNTIKQTEDALETALEMPGEMSDTVYGGLGLLDRVALQLEQGREGGVVVAHD